MYAIFRKAEKHIVMNKFNIKNVGYNKYYYQRHSHSAAQLSCFFLF